ncbi:MAG: hypothetical protein ACOYMN_01775, partial [Roseimicrobium sp.]
MEDLDAWYGRLSRYPPHKLPGVGHAELMQPFGGVSGNSGGTWFLSHLAYSDYFQNSLNENEVERTGQSIDGLALETYWYNKQVRDAFLNIRKEVLT